MSEQSLKEASAARRASSPGNTAFALTSFLHASNGAYIQALYTAFQKNPETLTPEWRAFFLGLTAGDLSKPSAAKLGRGGGLAPVEETSAPVDLQEVSAGVEQKIRQAVQREGIDLSQAQIRQAVRDSAHALLMIRAFRTRGHLHARLDPLGLLPERDHVELHPSSYGFSEADWDRKIFIDYALGFEFATIREMLSILRKAYCETLGVEFMHISSPEERSWIEERLEKQDRATLFSKEEKKAILKKLVEAEGFEKFLDLRYTGTKRFGLDGGESLIPALEEVIRCGSHHRVRDIVLGMPHRGRLNVLAHILGKPHRAIFHEFMGGSNAPQDVVGSGDVKYHLGASSDRQIDGHFLHLSLTANPSHLEIVNPVVLGKCRAKQDQHASQRADWIRTAEEAETADIDRSIVLPLLLHGDAAFAGQGVVAECMGLSALRGHRTGGSIHVIVNNQIGFTTNPRFSRSSPYPSDVAKMIEAPIFHCNGDDPEAVVYAARLATEFRQTFHKPVVLDLFCYRRFGHNETDEPAFTQPLMYQKIRNHPTALTLYAEKLEKEGVIGTGELAHLQESYRAHLEREVEAAKSYKPEKADWLDGAWLGLSVSPEDGELVLGETGVSLEKLQQFGPRLTAIPEGFTAHRTVERFLERRRKVIEAGTEIDWSTAEALAFATLLEEGHPIRLSGQDSERGTFSQRHSVLYDQNTERRTIPLNHLSDTQARFEVINSMLSEEAVLGYEYGYTLAEPNALTLWEAQFGDFANGAQVIFDQFLSSAERKWLRMSGLVCLLPHGYEGMGPEHSSARLERFLQMCAEDNMQVANCTTPANYFHILRRQLKRNFRKPLILMTPKSLLRHKRCVSSLEEFGPESHFHKILPDGAQGNPEGAGVTLAPDKKIRRVVLCSGKVYYDLEAERAQRGLTDLYILRLEQLFPFPSRLLVTELARFKEAEVLWCQEEPRNMGGWAFIQPYVEWALEHVGARCRRPSYAGREAAAATATGLMSKHTAQLQAIFEAVFTF